MTVTGPLPEATVRTFTNTDPGSSSFRYDATTSTWQFNLQTKEANGTNYPSGTYNVQIVPLVQGYTSSPVFQVQLK